VLEAIVAVGLIYLIAIGKPGFTLSGSNLLATNGFGVHSPEGYSLTACLVAEVALIFVFVIVILGSTDGRAPKDFALLAIGLALALVHLISTPITNLSVNPARSTGLCCGRIISASVVALGCFIREFWVNRESKLWVDRVTAKTTTL
jgi:aquaporin Z